MTFDSSLQFYVCKADTQLRTLVVTDIDDPFLATVPSELLLDVSQHRSGIDALLDTLPTMFAFPRPASACLGSAVQSAYLIMEEIGGKMLVFSSSLPAAGLGQLPMRDNPRAIGTDQEQALLAPNNPFYSTLAKACAQKLITVDLFLFAQGYIDVASLGVLSSTTGGQLYLYSPFSQHRHGEKFHMELSRNLTRQTGFEAIMRLRTSKSISVTKHHGHYFCNSETDLDLATIDADKSFLVEMSVTSDVPDKTPVAIQCALLYTTSMGERRIRVHTVNLTATSSIGALFRSSDLDSIVNAIARRALDDALKVSNLAAQREAFINKCVNILFAYRKYCATSPSAGQLILPESLKLFPLYTLGLIKCPMFRASTDMYTDERSYFMSQLSMAPAALSSVLVHSRLMPLSGLNEPTCQYGCQADNGRVILPPLISLSADKLDPDHPYLLENGEELFLYLGKNTDPSFLSDVLGLQSTSGVDLSKVRVRVSVLAVVQVWVASSARVSAVVKASLAVRV
jgi:protein transport protein SEC24